MGSRDMIADFGHVKDLTAIAPLSLSAVLTCLQERYLSNTYYTQAGSVLVAVNPFCDVMRLYGDDVIKEVHKVQSFAQDDQAKTAVPHVYCTAEKAYSRLRRGWGNQSIIVSGESGAGKTVSARHLLQYLVTVSQLDNRSSSDGMGGFIEKRILDSNPILEAFGNASTLRNENSSRFGKYIELHFDRSYKVIGASIKSFLLEKTRIVHQSAGECNFHIFYQMSQGAQKRVRDLCGNCLPRDLSRAFPGADCSARCKEKDVADLKGVLEGLGDFGVTETQLTYIYQVLVSLLLLCSLVFTSDFEDSDICDVSGDQQEVLKRTCELLGTSSTRLESTLTRRQITATHARRKSVFHKPCSSQEAALRRDSLAKLLYASLFDWLLNYINCHIEGPPAHATIGILDIYGFESFKKNSLEQLCINYANEKLQQHFVQHFLKDIQEEYEVEAIPWQRTEYEDNAPCLQLLDDHPGVFSILNEECHLNRAHDNQALAERLVDTLGSHKHYRRHVTEPGFTIVHFAQPVTYLCQDLLYKNKDNVPCEITELLRSSDNRFVAGLITNSAHSSSTPLGKAKKKTVLSKFKGSLDSLMSTLEETEAHFIRCLKPNSENRASCFHRDYVIKQLQACGLVQTVAISQRAFPARLLYGDFLKRYGMLLREGKRGPLQDITNSNTHAHASHNTNSEFVSNTHARTRENVAGLADSCAHGNSNTPAGGAPYDDLHVLYHGHLNTTPKGSNTSDKKRLRRRAGLASGDYTRRLCSTILAGAFGRKYSEKATAVTQFGRTKLFLTHDQVETLEFRRQEVMSQRALTIQCAWRKYRYQKRKEAVVTIQRAIRTWFLRRRLEDRVTCAKVIQCAYRKYRKRKQKEKAETNAAVATCALAGQQTDCDKRNDALKRKNAPPTLPKPKLRKQLNSARKDGVKVAPEASVWRKQRVQCSASTLSTFCAATMRVPMPLPEMCGILAETIRRAFEKKTLIYLISSLPGAPYLEVKDGVLSRRRMPRVQLKFHTKANPLLRYAHYIPQKELACSLTDCLQAYD